MIFCLQELEEFWVYKALLTELTKQLTYCVKTELIPLMEVAGVLEVSKPGFVRFSSVNLYAVTASFKYTWKTKLVFIYPTTALEAGEKVMC